MDTDETGVGRTTATEGRVLGAETTETKVLTGLETTGASLGTTNGSGTLAGGGRLQTTGLGAWGRGFGGGHLK